MASIVDPSLLIKLSGACRLLGISRPTAGKWIARDEFLGLVRFPGGQGKQSYRVRVSSLLDWLSEGGSTPTGAPKRERGSAAK